jgi:hypothetical protein
MIGEGQPLYFWGGFSKLSHAIAAFEAEGRRDQRARPIQWWPFCPDLQPSDQSAELVTAHRRNIAFGTLALF